MILNLIVGSFTSTIIACEISPGRRILWAIKQVSNVLSRDLSRAEQGTLPGRSLRLRDRREWLARTLKGEGCTCVEMLGQR